MIVQTMDRKGICSFIYLCSSHNDYSPPILIIYVLRLLFTYDKQIYCAHFSYLQLFKPAYHFIL